MFRWEQKGGLRLSPGDSVLLTLDRRQPGFQGEAGTYADGPVTGVVLRSYSKGLPAGTRLSGYLWTSGEFLVGRCTEAELPDGRTVPVCFALGRRGYSEKWEESKPGATVVGRSNPAYPVERWPWFPSESVKRVYKFGPSHLTQSE